MLVHLPAVHLQPGEIVTDAVGPGGILDCGRYPGGLDAPIRELAGRLETAGFSARPDAEVMRRKYAKLLDNLVNVLQAATDMAEGSRDILSRLKREAVACYAAAGIDCASQEETRERIVGTYRIEPIPGRPRLGGSTWQSLARGAGPARDGLPQRRDLPAGSVARCRDTRQRCDAAPRAHARCVWCATGFVVGRRRRGADRRGRITLLMCDSPHARVPLDAASARGRRAHSSHHQ